MKKKKNNKEFLKILLTRISRTAGAILFKFEIWPTLGGG